MVVDKTAILRNVRMMHKMNTIWDVECVANAYSFELAIYHLVFGIILVIS